GVVEREERRQRSGWRHSKDSPCDVASAVCGRSVKISLLPERQTVLGKGAVGAIEGDQRGENTICRYAEHRAGITETLDGSGAIETAVGAGNQLTVRASAMATTERDQGAERAVGRKS